MPARPRRAAAVAGKQRVQAAALVHFHCRLHVRVNDSEDRQERVQHGRVIHVAGVLDEQFPVRAHRVAVIARNLDGPAADHPEPRADRRAEIVLERRRRIAERAEYDAGNRFDLQFSEPVTVDGKVVGIAADAAHALHQRHADQVAVQRIAPLVIDAGEVTGIAAQVADDRNAPVCAAVDEGMKRAVLVPGQDIGRRPDITGDVVARFPDLVLEAEIAPGGPPEYPLLLQIEDRRVGIQMIGYAGKITARPDDSRSRVQRFQPVHCHSSRMHISKLSAHADISRGNTAEKRNLFTEDSDYPSEPEARRRAVSSAVCEIRRR